MLHSEGARGGANVVGLDGLVRGLDDLERIRCLRVHVLVWVKLNRQFAVKLGQFLGLHRRHLRLKHLGGVVQICVDDVGLLSSDLYRVSLTVHEALDLLLGLRCYLLLDHVDSLGLVHKRRSTLHKTGEVALSELSFHVTLSLSKHLLLHLGKVGVL